MELQLFSWTRTDGCFSSVSVCHILWQTGSTDTMQPFRVRFKYLDSFLLTTAHQWASSFCELPQINERICNPRRLQKLSRNRWVFPAHELSHNYLLVYDINIWNIQRHLSLSLHGGGVDFDSDNAGRDVVLRSYSVTLALHNLDDGVLWEGEVPHHLVLVIGGPDVPDGVGGDTGGGGTLSNIKSAT